MRLSWVIGSAVCVLVLAASVTYSSSPLFWKRYVNTFRSSGMGAAAPVFDYRQTVAASSMPWELPTNPDPVLNDETRDALVAFAEEFDSFALLVVHKGQLELEWYRDGYTRDSLTQSQSMHKSLQALLVGIAVDQGKIDSIDRPLRDFLPLASKYDGTVRDHLQMSSGLKPFDGGFSPFGEAFRWLYASDLDVATVQIPQSSDSGELFEYHDGNTQLLGMMLTEVFGEPYTDYLHRLIWDRIGAASADVWLDNEGGTPHHNCCLLARAIDWAKLGVMLANGGSLNGTRVVSESWLSQQISPNLTPHYGFQTWIASNAEPNPREGGGGYRRAEKWLADDVFYFSGYGAQRLYVSPLEELVIVRLGPAAGYFPKVAEEWDNTYLLNTVIRALRDPG